jgi:hypothetical protein
VKLKDQTAQSESVLSSETGTKQRMVVVAAREEPLHYNS